MKAFTVPLKKREIPYPKLRKCGDLIVLFMAPHMGTVIVPSSDFNVGYCYNNWDSSNFTDFEGEVVLSNEE